MRGSLVLRCRSKSHPDILLPPLKAVCIGSLSVTSASSLLPKRQLLLTTDERNERVRVRQLTSKASSLNNVKLNKDQVVKAKAGDFLELVQGRYGHVIQRVLLPSASESPKEDISFKPKETNMSSKDATGNVSEEMNSCKDDTKGSKASLMDSKDSTRDPKETAKRVSKQLTSSSSAPYSLMKGKTGHWSMGLLRTMQDPKFKVCENDDVIVIKDKYPKALHHLLIVPKEHIGSLKELRAKHLSIIEAMAAMARNVSGQLSLEEKVKGDVKFKIGFHSVPSMHQLHLHVISDDFDSPCLKTKKHWNSFNTDFFMPVEKVLKQLREHGRILVHAENTMELLKMPLKCNKCDYMSKTMPDLKSHLRSHD